MRFTMSRYAACIVFTLMVSAALKGAARAAVLVDINADGNQDAVFSGFALREVGTVAYWQLDEAGGDLVDVVTHDGAARTLTGGTGLTYLQPNVAPDPVTNPDAGPFTSGTTNDNPSSIDFAGASIAPKTTNAAPSTWTVCSTTWRSGTGGSPKPTLTGSGTTAMAGRRQCRRRRGHC